MAKIKVWSSRHLSFIGRLQVINSVLISFHAYWAQVFILPKHILKSIECVCRAFLWQDTYISSKPGYVSVCKSKRHGGLGVRNERMWNFTALGKYIWAISTKQDLMWVRWVNSIYIKDRDWWHYQPKADSGWYWRIFVQLRSN